MWKKIKQLLNCWSNGASPVFTLHDLDLHFRCKMFNICEIYSSSYAAEQIKLWKNSNTPCNTGCRGENKIEEIVRYPHLVLSMRRRTICANRLLDVTVFHHRRQVDDRQLNTSGSGVDVRFQTVRHSKMAAWNKILSRSSSISRRRKNCKREEIYLLKLIICVITLKIVKMCTNTTTKQVVIWCNTM